MARALPEGLVVRDEQPRDVAAIHDLTRRAFAPMPYAGGNEQDLVDGLRAARALSVSLVAELEDSVVGHIALSPASTADGRPSWYALGPVSVEPALQRRSIGSALVRAGLERLRERGAAGCILVGDPRFYSRFGFAPAAASAPKGEPAEYFQVASFGDGPPGTTFAFHPIFASEHE